MKYKQTVFWLWFVSIIIGAIPWLTAEHVVAAENCPPGELVGSPPSVTVPTYDYGSDDLVQFHFQLLSGEWNYNTLRLQLFDENCSLISESSRGQVGGAYLPASRNILVKVAEFSPGKYNFQVFDEDSGDFFGTGLGFVPNDFNSPIIRLNLINVGGPFHAPVVDSISTPAVPLIKPQTASSLTPVIVIPGVMGTELYKNSELVWPNIKKMLTDVNDDFINVLGLDNDLKPLDPDLTVGQVIGQPFPGEHYYDLFLDQLQSDGYEIGQNLFTLSYDWRFGTDAANIKQLADLIDSAVTVSGRNQVNIVAHSTGGLLLKKYVSDYGSDKINKVVLAGVPHLGTPKATKILIAGDNLGIPWLDRNTINNISRNMPVVYDLLPSASYIKKAGNYLHIINQELTTSTKQTLDYEQTTQWLSNNGANSQALARAQQLHSPDFDMLDTNTLGREVYTIAGCRTPTIGTVTETTLVLRPAPIRTFSMVAGDETVPMQSALSGTDPGRTYYSLTGRHSKLLSQNSVQELVRQIISDEPLAVSEQALTKDSTKCGLEGMLVRWSGKVKTIFHLDDQPVALSDLDTEPMSLPDNVVFEQQDSQGMVYIPKDNEELQISFITSESDDITVDIEQYQNNHLKNYTFPTIAMQGNAEFKPLILNGIPQLNVDQNHDGDFEQVVLPISPSEVPANPPVPSDIIESELEENKSQGGNKIGTPANSINDENHLIPPQGPQFTNATLQRHPDGTLIQDGTTIYLLQDGQRRPFRSWGEYIASGYGPGTPELANEADRTLPEGLPMVAKTGTLVTVFPYPTPQTYYLIGERAEKRPFTSPEALNKYGYSFQNTVVVENLGDYVLGENVSAN